MVASGVPNRNDWTCTH